MGRDRCAVLRRQSRRGVEVEDGQFGFDGYGTQAVAVSRDHGPEALGGLRDVFEFRGDVSGDDEGMAAPSGEGWPQQGIGLCLPGRDQWVEQLGASG